MSMIGIIAVVAPGLSVGAGIGIAMRAAGHREVSGTDLKVLIAGVLTSGVLAQHGHGTWAATVGATLFGWAVGMHLAVLPFGRGGGGPDDDTAAPQDPGPGGCAVDAPADGDLWDEFDTTPVYNPAGDVVGRRSR